MNKFAMYRNIDEFNEEFGLTNLDPCFRSIFDLDPPLGVEQYARQELLQRLADGMRQFLLRHLAAGLEEILEETRDHAEGSSVTQDGSDGPGQTP